MLHRSVKGRNSGRILDKQHIKLVRGPVTMSVNIDDCKIGTFAYGVTGSKYKGKIGWITNVGNITKRVTIQYSDNRKQAWALRNIRFAYAEEIDETIKTSAPYLDFVRENGTINRESFDGPVRPVRDPSVRNVRQPTPREQRHQRRQSRDSIEQLVQMIENLTILTNQTTQRLNTLERLIMTNGNDGDVRNDRMNEEIMENSLIDVMIPNNYVRRYDREQEEQETEAETMSLSQGGDLSVVHPSTNND